ncbi:MBL fold metallo-hydrolase [Marinobacter nauticus]|uniref:MBL fold metallo-hydrolase n=1 Tax=Marinobacter nauticus TaxID=2743 RepID=UPI00112FCF96|nr:MBL fold metallo-hydrolase [Marinobacter nauticus]TPW24468.1 MBL fold metallo-hydrolase [Marinobacter nauticus]
MIHIHILPALYGDSFFIQSKDESFSFLVDCGYKKTYFNEIRKLTKSVNFIILTHIDEDHILGAIPLVEDIPEKFAVGKVYLNTPDLIKADKKSENISVSQAVSLQEILADKGIDQLSLVQGDEVVVSNDCKIFVISPSNKELNHLELHFRKYKEKKPDYTPVSVPSENLDSIDNLSKRKDSFKSKKSDFVNASSIAFILYYRENELLFLGDSHPTVVEDYLRSMGYNESQKALFNYVKLSHHGSISSISLGLISIIQCSKFIVSTIGGRSNNKHPSRETLCKLAVHVDRGLDEFITFIFNYPVEQYEARNGKYFSAEELAEYKIKMIYKKTLELE